MEADSLLSLEKTPTSSVKKLADIAVTKASAKTAYYRGDKFEPADIEVTASYPIKCSNLRVFCSEIDFFRG